MVAKVSHFVVLAIFLGLVGCSHSSISIKKSVGFDHIACQPASAVPEVAAKSQAECHVAVAGSGIQILISKVERKISLSSDTTRRELTSIYIHSEAGQLETGDVDFEAFYSRGLFDLTGKTGCIGVLKDGDVKVEPRRGQRIVSYDLTFKLVSPLGWPDECKSDYRAIGSAVF